MSPASAAWANDKERLAVVYDRSRLFVDAVETILRPRVTIAAKATTTDEAIELVEQHRPDLLIAGIDAEPEEVIALVREALALRPALKVIVLSSTSDSRLLADTFEAGVAVFIAQNGSADDIAVAIRQTSDPSIYFAPEPRPAPEPVMRASSDTGLTDREIETLRLVAEGLSNAEVGRTLWVTEQTVKFHLSNIFRKLNVSNRTQASRRAQLMNLIPDEQADVPAIAN